MSKYSNQKQKPTKQEIKFFNINGSEYTFDCILTILDLIEYLGFNKNVIVIDYNGILLEKQFWKKTYLKNRDFLEILSIAGGG